MTENPKDFFISYTSADETWATWIAWVLEEAGYTTLVQAWGFSPVLHRRWRSACLRSRAAGTSLLRPDRKDEPLRHGNLGSIR